MGFFLLAKRGISLSLLPPQGLYFYSFTDNLRYFIIIILMTHNKNRAHANKSFAKHNPATKYAILKMVRSKSDIFVLCE